jgi:lipopolysaccharide/colanic/teichoic acid biosynthesis glycosyltransferase
MTNKALITFFDLFFSTIGLVLLSPFFLIISLWVKLDSKGPVFYKQIRVGKNAKDFNLLKFRTMEIGSDKKGLLTIGEKDNRITNSGYFLRKYKFDELPQLINVVFRDMYLVGPRPEVKKYVILYTPLQQKVLSVRPGISDFASIEYSNENELLNTSENPEEFYINKIMPEKIELNMKFINNPTLAQYFKVIFLTIFKIIS